MSRLTDKDSYCLMHCADDYDSGIDEDCNINKICFERKMYDKLKHYEDLEEQGRLIELPCKLYEEVWVAHEQIATFKKRFERESTIVDWMEQGYVIGHTKAEAEAKLAELKGTEE